MTSSLQDAATSAGVGKSELTRLLLAQGLHAVPVEPKRAHWWSRTRKATQERSRRDRRKRAAILAFIGFAVVLGSIESLAVRGQADFGRWELGLSGLWVYTVAVA